MECYKNDILKYTTTWRTLKGIGLTKQVKKDKMCVLLLCARGWLGWRAWEPHFGENRASLLVWVVVMAALNVLSDNQL